MFKNIIAAVSVVLLFTACSTMQISTDHDPEFDLTALNNYTVKVQKQSDDATLTDRHISRAITNELDAKGYHSTPEAEADFYVLFQLDVQDKTEVRTTYESWGVRPYPYYAPDGRLLYPPGMLHQHYIDPFNFDMTTQQTQTFDYQEGKLLVDVYDPKSKRIVWRGIAKDELKNFSTAEEKIAYINAVIQKLLHDFPSKVTGK